MKITFTHSKAHLALFSSLFVGTIALSACGGGDSTLTRQLPFGAGGSSGSGSGSGSGGSSGSGGASGGASSSPSPSPSPAAALSAGPGVIDASVGNVAQIGVLDPSNAPLTVTASGGTLPGLLNTIAGLTNGVLMPSGKGTAQLTLTAPAGTTLASLLGPNGSTLQICVQNTTNCTTVQLTGNALNPAFTSSLASVALTPGNSTTLSLSALPGVNPNNFTLVSSNANVTTQALGNGSFSINVAANAGVPTSVVLTASDGAGHQLQIPVEIF